MYDGRYCAHLTGEIMMRRGGLYHRFRSLYIRWACQHWSRSIFYTTLLVFLLFWPLLRWISSAGTSAPHAARLPAYLASSQLSALFISPDQPLQHQLSTAFNRADKDGDTVLSADEIADWLQLKIAEHVTMAIKNNINEFTSLDQNPRNGWIEWSEFVERRLRQLRLKSQSDLSDRQKESLMFSMAEFSEAALTSPPTDPLSSLTSASTMKLTVDELLRFQHREASHSYLLEQLTELTDSLDENGDDMLSFDEWKLLADSSFQPSAELQTLLPTGHQLRSQLHFQLDSDGDKQLSQNELLVFLDIRHKSHAVKHTESMIHESDADSDSCISLNEALMHTQIFRVLVDAKFLLHPKSID